jgi:hypothetical protein
MDDVQINACMALTKLKRPCRNCVTHVQPKKINNKYFVLCVSHRNAKEVTIQNQYRDMGVNLETDDFDSTLYMNPETCFVRNSSNRDAEYESNSCSQKKVQFCLKDNNLKNPIHNKVTLAERMKIQAETTKNIAATDFHREASLKSIVIVSRFITKFFPTVLLLVKGSAAMRVQMDAAIHDPNSLFKDEIKENFETVLKRSDVDTTLILDPETEHYDKTVGLLMESLSLVVLKFCLQHTNPRKLAALNNTISSDNENVKATFTTRAPLHVDQDKYDEHEFHLRELWKTPSITKDPTNKFYSVKLPVQSLDLFKISSDVELFISEEPLRVFHVIKSKQQKETYHFMSLRALRNVEGYITFKEKNETFGYQCRFSEDTNHARGIHVEFVHESPEDKSLITDGVHIMGRKVQLGNLNFKTMMFDETKILPRHFVGLRYLVDLSRLKLPITLSYQRHISVMNSYHFSLLRMFLPIDVNKGKNNKFSKAEILDISCARFDDHNLHYLWEKFKMENRDNFTTRWCSKTNNSCVTTVNMNFQMIDLKRMEGELINNKSSKRSIRIQMIKTLQKALGIGKFTGKELVTLQEKFPTPVKQKLNMAASQMLVFLLSDSEMFQAAWQSKSKENDQSLIDLFKIIEGQQSSMHKVANIPYHVEAFMHKKDNFKISPQIKYIQKLYELF